MKYPEQNENYDVDVFNDNFRELDLKGEQLGQDLQAEVARADAAEKANADAISAEAERATAQETIIDNKFTAEAAAIRSLIDTAYASANGYTDEKIADLINGAPETLDTLKEIADALEQNEDVVEALNNAIGTKADQNELDLHTSNTEIHVTVSDKSGWNNPVFTEAEERENIASGDSTPTLWGKVKKWFSSLKAVCFSGSYNDLSDTPTIGNATIKIKQGGVEKGSFTTNQSGEDVIVELEESGGSVDPSDITPASIGAVAKTGDKMTGRLIITTPSASPTAAKLITGDEGNQRIFYGSDSIESVTPGNAIGILKLNPEGNANNGRIVTGSLLHVKGGISVDQGLESVGEDLREYRYIPVFNEFTADPGTGGIVRYAHRKNSGLAPYYHWTTSSNDAGYYYKITVGARDTDIGIVNWMISFNLTVYQSYRYCKFAISGYVYKASNSTPISWYEPRAEMVEGDSAIDNRFVYFGKDQSEHLYVAIDALMYAGITIDNINVSYNDIVLDYSTLFSLSKEPTLDNTTKYTQKLAYRPFYLDEANELKNSVSNGKAMVASAITAKGVSTAADADFLTMANNIGNIYRGTRMIGSVVGVTRISNAANCTVSFSVSNKDLSGANYVNVHIVAVAIYTVLTTMSLSGDLVVGDSEWGKQTQNGAEIRKASYMLEKKNNYSITLSVGGSPQNYSTAFLVCYYGVSF